MSSAADGGDQPRRVRARLQITGGNPYDGHTLNTTIDQVVALSGIGPDRIYIDPGYRGRGADKNDRVFITRQRRGLTPTIKRELRRRSAIEPMIQT